MDFDLFQSQETQSMKFYVEFPTSADLDTVARLLDIASRELRAAHPPIAETVVIAGWQDYNYRHVRQTSKGTLEVVLRERLQGETAAELSGAIERRLLALPGVVALQRTLTMNAAPPADAPVQIYLYGNHDDDLATSVDAVIGVLEAQPGVQHVRNPLADGLIEQTFTIDAKRAMAYGLEPRRISALLRAALTGIELQDIELGTEVVPVYVVGKPSVALSTVIHAAGHQLPLEQLGRLERAPAAHDLTRRNDERFVAVTAEVDESVASAFAVHARLDPALAGITLPATISFEQRGERSDTEEALADMVSSAFGALALSFVVLAALFRSYLQPLLMFIPVPLALMGVIWGFGLTGQPMSLFGLVGVIGLIGIAVNNAIVWVSFYNRLRQDGLDAATAASRAVELRFPAIVTTTVTTVVGLLPTSLAGGAGAADAVADAIVYGLVVSSLLLFVFLPAFTVALDRPVRARVSHPAH
jgi:multidrug efflux pump subunit AcrB